MKKANILATAVLATLLAACSNDSDVLNTPDYADTPIGLNVNVGPMATRAGYDNTNLTGSSFGLYLTTEGTNSDERYNCTNREVRYESGWTIQGGQLLWKSNDATVTYYAYLPYTGTVGDAASYAFTVQTDQSSDSNVKASDFLCTGTQTATAGTALDINFQHALSKLNVTLTKGTELEDGLTFKSVKLSNCATEIVVNLLEGTIVKTTNSGQTITLYATTENKQYECILVPQTFAQSLKVEITDNNGKVYTFTSNKDLTFASGEEYTLNLTVGRDKVTTGTISADPWGEEQQGGDLVTE
ncbi:fimbrillin family protein [Phocaeicola sp. Sa1CVN1]|uniref:Fimbrillin family protein n=1 Tax=Phocaeicola intestinalis TaxID=2762212 RepID=A0ABR8YCQ3_9BACT|nr:fimbrillin family protein [Phocaeicola intestinalis]MBD8041999.1 fimbrillin family protein [Phocaeicola intestinalis]